MIDKMKIGVIGGAGWLGSIIVNAIIKTNTFSMSHVGVSYRNNLPSDELNIFKTHNNQELVDWSDVVILSVRPADFSTLTLDVSNRLVISIMAGVTIDHISDAMKTRRVIRALPNIAALVGQSYTPWTGSFYITEEDRVITSKIFSACGLSDEVSGEKDIDYLTGFSGSGPAYPALLADAMSRHAIAFGIKREIAIRAAMQTMIGAGRLFEHDKKDPANIVQEFVDYKGVIAAAIDAMRRGGFDNSIDDGMDAGINKSFSLRIKS